MHLLAGKVAETLSHLKIDKKRFEIIRDKVRLDKKNFEMEQPYNWALYNTTHALRTPRWHNTDKVKMLTQSSAVAGFHEYDFKAYLSGCCSWKCHRREALSR